LAEKGLRRVALPCLIIGKSTQEMDPSASDNEAQPNPLTYGESGQSEPLPVSIPDHKLLRCIGHGSYGQVWLALNTMGTYRAVKVVRRNSFHDRRPFERELSGIRRFEPISRSHEGFVDILQAGINEQEGYFYYVMELGDDIGSGTNIFPEKYSPKTLAKEIRMRGKLSWQECLELGLALSRALAELHKHELVHRDVKPSNVIFVNGVPKLADIGLVADLKAAPSYVGTEGFIPPEGPGSAQADVYGLGKVLYEASTGKDRQDFPELSTAWDQSPDHKRLQEMNEVVLRACQNERDKRYATAWDMYSDLLILSEGQSVLRLRALEKAFTRIKRIAGISSLALLVLAGFGYETYRVRRNALEVQQQKLGSSIAYGNSSMKSGDLFGALPHFVEAFRLDGGNSDREREHRVRLGSVMAQCAKLTRMWSRPKQVDTAAFSPDGNHVLVIESYGSAQVLDIHSGKPVSPSFGKAHGLRQGAYSPEGESVVTADEEDHAACVWNASDGTLLYKLDHPDKVLCARFSPEGTHIVTACLDGIARVWNLETRTIELRLKGHTAAVLFAAYSQDGRRIVTSGKDGSARLWNSKTGEQLQPSFKHNRWVVYAAFSPDGQQLITACNDHRARVWDLATGRKIPPDLEHLDVVSSVQFSPDGQLILTGSLDGTARLWRAENHQPINPNPILWHSDRVMEANFCSDGHGIATACVDGTVRIWDLAGGSVAPPPLQNSFSPEYTCFLTSTNDELRVWEAFSGKPKGGPIKLSSSMQSFKLGHSGRFILTSSLNDEEPSRRSVEIRETTTGNRFGPPLLLTNAFENFSLSKDGHCLLGFDDELAHTWKVSTGEPMVQGMKHPAKVGGAVFGPSSGVVATWGGSVVKVWNSATGEDLFAPLKHSFNVEHVEFNSDGTRLVTCGNDSGFTRCHAQVWNMANGHPIGPRLGHRDGVLWASLSRDGNRVATAGEDFRAMVWESVTGKPLTAGLLHQDQVMSAAFCDNGKWVITASSDQTARIWNAENGDPLTPPLRHLAKLRYAVFLGDGRRVVTSDKKGGISLWDLPLEESQVADLVKLVRVLSGDAITVSASSGLGPRSSESLQALWEDIRAKHPAWFETSSQEVVAWHRFEADQSELEGHWFAAALHLEYLSHLLPGDLLITQRLGQAKDHTKHID
jgi:WD40 repeat protein